MPPSMKAMPRLGPGPWVLASVLAPASGFIPFALGLATGGSFYFRDLMSYFYPVRRFVVEGLRSGEMRQWNPYAYEGVPLLPVSYPPDLLQVLVPSEWGFSLLLALHVPLAALTFLSLARRLEYHPAAATLGAIAYALSGFSLSCVNLYLMVQALAWAPLVISMLLRARAGGARDVALAGVSVAMCLSTTGLEIAAQAIACGLLLSASGRAAHSLRPVGGVLLGVGLAGFSLAGVLRVLAGSRRQGGFSLGEALDQSVHPVSLLQSLVAGLYGDPVASGYSYWGARFWGGQSPYFVSLYLGGAVLCLAAVGALRAERLRVRLLLLLAGALLVSLGRFARLDLLLEALPAIARFRFPVKAFFTVVMATSLLAAAGADALLKSRRAWRPLAASSALLGAGLVSLPLLEAWLPGSFAWLRARFFASSFPQSLRDAALRSVASDAAAGAIALFATAALGALVLRRLIRAEAAVVAVVAVVAADLLRAGAGLNPTAHRSLYTLSPEMTRVAARLRQAGGRAFTCTIQAMPTFREAAPRVGRIGLWTAGVWRETLSTHANMDAGVPTAGWDATGAVPAGRTLTQAEAMCREASALPRLRQSGVRHVLSVQAFTNEELRLVEVAQPARTQPLSIYVYELADSPPDPVVWSTPDDLDAQAHARALEGARARYVEDGWGRVRVAVESPRDAWLVVRRTHAAGWRAMVNGAAAPVLLANGRHQAIPVPKGASEVVLRYRPPGGVAGALATLLSAVIAAALGRRARETPAPAAP